MFEGAVVIPFNCEEENPYKACEPSWSAGLTHFVCLEDQEVTYCGTSFFEMYAREIKPCNHTDEEPAMVLWEGSLEQFVKDYPADE
jgi:hypothetical protein